MYKDYFRFNRYPFQNTPDPEFYFNSRSHREALATMLYGVREGKGFVLITGDVGTGKTMLVQALKKELGDGDMVIEISNPWVSHEEILSALYARLGIVRSERDEPALLDALRHGLAELDQAGRRVILAIDEAHQLPERTLEGIRLLSNIETSTRKLLQIILLGQEELSSMLGRYSLRQLQQRIGLSFHLTPLNAQDTEEYIRHRLRVAGVGATLFPRECVDLIHRESLGCPRVINQICDNCLLFAYGKNLPAVDLVTLQEVMARSRPDIAKTPPAPVESIVEPRTALNDINNKDDEEVKGVPVAREFPPEFLPIPPLPGQGNARQHFDEPPVKPMSAPVQMPQSRPVSAWFVIFVALVVGLAIGAIAFAWFQQTGMKATETRPVALNSQSASSKTAAKEIGKGAIGEMSPVTSVPHEIVPFPFSKEFGSGEPVRLKKGESISMLASKEFGAWNETLEDILFGLNEAVEDMDSPPEGMQIRFPRLNRDSMISRDGKGMAFIYYASFGNEEAAKATLETLRSVWPGAFLDPADRHGKVIYRVYLGKYADMGEAQAVVRSVWFKFLPSLN